MPKIEEKQQYEMLIDIPYRTEEKRLKSSDKLSNSELTMDYLTHAVNQKYPQGLHGQLRRMWGRIQRRIDDSILDNKTKVDLDKSEWEFIKNCVEDAKYSASIAKYVLLLEAEINRFFSN